MNYLARVTTIILFLSISCALYAQNKKFGIVIHGGAGRIVKENMSDAQEKFYREKLEEALKTGYTILENNGSSIDAVSAAINILEDSPLFNAGKGAVLTNEGKAELDASIMDGKNLAAGAVAGVSHIKNPINLARLVMEKSPHVFLIGEGAELFAKENNIEMVENNYFITDERWNSYLRMKKSEDEKKKASKSGTVGAVALDKDGNLAAGTSTGGMMMKRYGRVGDAPIIGAGTYANNNTCAVSATGYGEYFIRLGIAKDISALMEYKNYNLEQAANDVINNKLTSLGGYGGVICIDKGGNISMPFTTEGMFRGFYVSDKNPSILLFKND
ncbi:MAG: isoaspartyl peptidase/L-asparaginase [Ignavibacteria bacterium]|nr:isoaspartyl peptidase/L-asparaginase [Ignavibacteria bacterium]